MAVRLLSLCLHFKRFIKSEMDLGRGWCVNKDVCVCVCVCVCVNCELTKAFKVHLCHRPKHSVCLLCKLVLRAGSVFLWGGFSTSCSHWAQGRSGTTLQVKEITFLRSTRMDISFDHFFQNTTFYILVPSWKKKKQTLKGIHLSLFCLDESASAQTVLHTCSIQREI